MLAPNFTLRGRCARPSHLVVVALTNDPHRLGQYVAGEAAPVARRRQDHVGLDQLHAIDLARVGADEIDLLLDEVGDVDEPVGFEVDGRGRRLIAIDVGYAARRHQTGGMDGAMILVGVLCE